MYYTSYFNIKAILIAFWLSSGLIVLSAQAPRAILVSNHHIGEIDGTWQFELASGNTILEVSQSGTIAIGTFDDAPVIVNIAGDQVKFKCEKKDAKGYKTTYFFRGKLVNKSLSGKMTIYSKKDKSFNYLDLTAVRTK